MKRAAGLKERHEHIVVPVGQSFAKEAVAEPHAGDREDNGNGNANNNEQDDAHVAFPVEHCDLAHSGNGDDIHP